MFNKLKKNLSKRYPSLCLMDNVSWTRLFKTTLGLHY